MWRKCSVVLLALILAVSLLLGANPAVKAQGGQPIPITIGENQTGELTEAQPVLSYVVASSLEQTVNIQVFAITQGFIPAFSVFDPSGVSLQTMTGTNNQTAIQVTSLPLNFGAYRIDVQSANGSFGQFLISVQPGAPLAPPQSLALGQPLTGTVSAESAHQLYSFLGSETEVLLVTVTNTTQNAIAGPVVLLKDAGTQETLGAFSSRLAGGRFRIPPGLADYRVQVSHSGAPNAETFTICLESETGDSPRCPGGTTQPQTFPTIAPITAVPTISLPPLPTTGPCVVASATGGSVNIRSGPNTTYSIVGQLAGAGTAPVVGRLPDYSWYQINSSGIYGWISSSVVRVGGQCAGVPTAMPPTGVPTPTSMTIPTATPTGATATPTATWTPTVTATIAPAATLNFNLPPNYGSTALTSGFVPDPFTVGTTSGGSIDASYLGGGCTGFVTASPDFSVNYTSGAFPTLRFYFVGSGDTTMIINSPSGTYTCVDDSFGTLNPTIDFNTPSSGRYDIWIGSYASGTFVSGTLNVTENTGNHP
jgi:hypothetical protein